MRMEAPCITSELDNEDQVLKGLLDTFGSAFSLAEIASAFCKAGRDTNMASEILAGMPTSPSANATHISKGLNTSETSSKAINKSGCNKLCYTNRDSSIAPKLKTNPASTGNVPSGDGKKYVWRIAGSKSIPNETISEKVEVAKDSVASVSSIRGKNCVWRIVGSNNIPNGISDAYPGSSQRSLSANNANLNDVDFENFQSKSISNEAIYEKVDVAKDSVATVSSIHGKNCVWRIVGSNNIPNGISDAYPGSSQRSLSADNANLNDVDIENFQSKRIPNETISKKVDVAKDSVATVSSIRGKNCVWRIAGSNNIPNGIKPLKVQANGFSAPVNTPEKSLLTRNAYPSSSQRSSSANNANSNDDEIENFLFEMLGRGFQVERSAIRKVLGQCGYDMKKSLETLLDLTAVTLDRKTKLCEDKEMHSNSNSLPSKNRVQRLKSTGSNGSKTMRSNLDQSRKSSERYEQQKAVSTAVCHAVEPPGFTASAPLELITRSRATGALVTEPVEDSAEDYDDEEGSYNILRKAVKEHRETMKGYYRAAAEAFARGDRDQAVLMLEKGQFFYHKAREADEESTTKIFETSGGDGETQDEMSLDLQDHDAKEAIRLVKFHLRTLSGIPLVRHLKIIIGSGDRDVEKRKRLVLKLLEKEAIKWIEDENCGAILIRLDEINPKSLSFGAK